LLKVIRCSASTDVALEETDIATWTPRPGTVSRVGEESIRAETRR